MKYQGTVVEPPELRFTPTGKAVCNMYVDIENERLTVVAWEDLADKITRYVYLEDKVEIFGTKKTRWWTNLDGEKVSREEIIASRVRVVERPIYPQYCCLSCAHWEADCLAGCYHAFGGPDERELCNIIEGMCMESRTDGAFMNRDCWERR